jgi:PrcB C-terminal
MHAEVDCAGHLGAEYSLRERRPHRPPPGLEPGPQLGVVRLAPTTASFAYSSGLRMPSRTVVRTLTEWVATWAAIHQPRQPVPPLPAIDFTQEMILVVALGERPTGGYSIFVDQVFEADDRGIDVVVRSLRPAFGCVVTDAVTQPVDVARVPLREGPTRFWDRSEAREC